MDFSTIDLKEYQSIARSILLEAVSVNPKNRKEFERLRNRLIKASKGRIFHNLYFIKAYEDLMKEGLIQENPSLLSFIQKRSIRTLSGVAPVTVMTKPFPCPGKCVYCPTDVRMPKSYLPSQPAAQRAFRQQFNPYTQVFVRLKSLVMTGHPVSKVELRVIGGTWSSYPKRYQTWFLKRCLQAMNEFSRQMAKIGVENIQNFILDQKIFSPYGVDQIHTVILNSLRQQISWNDAVKQNEISDVRCIGINIETRPDCIDKKEIRRLRNLGVTKVEIGVQTTDDHVQELTKRGHDLLSVQRATALLKDSGFKIGYHMMPNLPGSTIELDKKMIGELFQNSSYQPDYLKIYPCVVVPKAALVIDYRKGLYKPYDDETLIDILMAELRSVPEWCRIDRIARDIPATDIEGGSRMSNIRQVLEKRLIEEGTPCRDIRSREIQNILVVPSNIRLVVRQYDANGGLEIFLSYEDIKNDKIVALLRLRFPHRTFLNELQGTAIIREVHVYGKQIAIGEHSAGQKQHVGWGSKLMIEAEKLAFEGGFRKMAVIAGIGTREYYRKKGYILNGTYMLKNLA